MVFEEEDVDGSRRGYHSNTGTQYLLQGIVLGFVD